MDVQVGQVNAGSFHQFIGIEEHVVVAATIGVGRVANKGQFCLVNGFRRVDDAVSVVVVSTGSVLVVVVPLCEHEPGVVGAVFVVINAHRGVVAWIDIAILIDGVESVSIVLKVERHEIAAHACQINVRDCERLVGPSIVVAERTGITRVAKPVGVVVENFR